MPKSWAKNMAREGNLSGLGFAALQTRSSALGKPSFSLRIEVGNLDYSIRVSRDRRRPGTFRVTREELRSPWQTKIYTSHPSRGDPVRAQSDDTHLLLRMAKTGDQRKYGHRIAVRPDQPALTQIREHKRVVRRHKEFADQVIQTLARIRFLDLEPNLMRPARFPQARLHWGIVVRIYQQCSGQYATTRTAEELSQHGLVS